jgi:hypothetical protein
MKRVAILLMLMFIPLVSASPIGMTLPEEAQIGSITTFTEVLTMNSDLHWGIGSSWCNQYFYPFGEDIPTRYGGIWRHLETREVGISWNITKNRYINWTDDTMGIFNISVFSFRWGVHSFVVYNVTEGYSDSVSSDAIISEKGIENGVSVEFGMSEWGEEFQFGEFITIINTTIRFETTWEYWEWVCGGVQPVSESRIPFALYGIVIIVLFAAWQINKWEQKNARSLSE